MADEDDIMSDSSDSDTSNSFTGAPKLSEFDLFNNEADSGTLKGQQEKNAIVDGGDPLRHYLYLVVENKVFNFSILTVILINTIFIGLHTSDYIVATSDWYLTLLENIFLSVYVMELIMKMYVWRLKFFLISWNIFDFIIVVASMVDLIIPLIVQNMINFNTQVLKVFQVFRAIKALKAFRVLRTIRFLKKLQIIVTAVLKSIPAMGSIVILISLVLYIFAIIGRGLYGEVAPERFGNLAKACFTLFQLITLDDWFYMYSDIRDNHPNHQHILVYLVLFIILETFIFINLFVAVIVDNLARTQAAASSTKKQSIPSAHHRVSDHDSELDVTTNNRKQSLLQPSERRQRLIDEFYQTERFTKSELDLLSRYWHLLLSLEHHIKLNNDKQRTLNEVVDLIDLTKI